MSRWLVLGGAGFIGSHLVEQLVAAGAQVTVFDNFSSGRLANLAAVEGKITLYPINVCSTELPWKLAKADYVVHLAASVGVRKIMEQPFSSQYYSAQATHHLLDAMLSARKQNHTPVLFYASSSEVYGSRPAEPLWHETHDVHLGHKLRYSYAAGKLADEFLIRSAVRERGIRAHVGRFFNVAGPRQSALYGMVLPRFVQAACAGKPLAVYGDGKQKRTFMHVKDAAAAIRWLCTKVEPGGGVYNIGAPHETHEIEIKDLALRVQTLCNTKSSVVHANPTAVYGSEFAEPEQRRPDIRALLESGFDITDLASLDEIITDVALSTSTD